MKKTKKLADREQEKLDELLGGIPEYDFSDEFQRCRDASSLSELREAAESARDELSDLSTRFDDLIGACEDAESELEDGEE